MDDPVVLRPVIEDDLLWLERMRNDPAATGPHEWHGWRDPGAQRRQWAESGLLTDSGGTLMVICGTEQIGAVSWRKAPTGQISYCWAPPTVPGGGMTR